MSVAHARATRRGGAAGARRAPDVWICMVGTCGNRLWEGENSLAGRRSADLIPRRRTRRGGGHAELPRCDSAATAPRPRALSTSEAARLRRRDGLQHRLRLRRPLDRQEQAALVEEAHRRRPDQPRAAAPAEGGAVRPDGRRHALVVLRRQDPRHLPRVDRPVRPPDLAPRAHARRRPAARRAPAEHAHGQAVRDARLRPPGGLQEEGRPRERGAAESAGGDRAPPHAVLGGAGTQQQRRRRRRRRPRRPRPRPRRRSRRRWRGGGGARADDEDDDDDDGFGGAETCRSAVPSSPLRPTSRR